MTHVKSHLHFANSSLAATKLSKEKAIACAMSSASNAAKKKRIKGSGRKTQGLPPHITPPPTSAPHAASRTVPAAQECRGLQKSKSGSSKHPKSSFWEMHRMNPPSIPTQKDHQVGLSGRHLQTSQGGTSVSSQAESKGTRPRDQGGVGHSGSSRSSSHHKRTNQGQESSTSLGPPRPAPVATATSGTLAANTSDQASGGMYGQSGHHHRQPEGQEWGMIKKVRYSFCWSIEIIVCQCVSIPTKS